MHGEVFPRGSGRATRRAAASFPALTVVAVAAGALLGSNASCTTSAHTLLRRSPVLFEPEVSRRLREHLVETQLVPRGIRDPRVLEAFRTVPREAFVPDALAPRAYEDCALPIEHGQTISQPYIVARTLEALGLRGEERALEIGTGTGYVAALLTRLAREVVSIERIPELAASSRAPRASGLPVDVGCGDGTLGWRSARRTTPSPSPRAARRCHARC